MWHSARVTDDDRTGAMLASLLAFWEAYARGATGAGARVHRGEHATAGVFPARPESAIFNNAVVHPRAELAPALREISAVYAEAGIDRWATWTLSGDPIALQMRFVAEGYEVSQRGTHAMALDLGALAPAPATVEPTFAEVLRDVPMQAITALNEVPASLVAGVGREVRRYGLLAGGELVSGLIAIDHEDDCTVAFVVTAIEARGRGHATTLVRAALEDAAARGRRTATLQSEAAAVPLYGRLGFRTIGFFSEWDRSVARS